MWATGWIVGGGGCKMDGGGWMVVASVGWVDDS